MLDVLYFTGIAEWWWMLICILVYVHLLVLGAIYIQWNFYLRSYNKGTDGKYIALTFDDGPAGETTRILDILREQNVQAAFFTIGERADAQPEVVSRWYHEGHLIGNHSYKHGFNFDWLPAKKMATEINATNDVIEKITGYRPKHFRPPYGVTNPNLARAIKLTGMYSIGWNVRSFDTKAKDKAVLLNRILTRLKGGDIILLHDSMPITEEILTDLITRAREMGFTFARVDKLLSLETV